MAFLRPARADAHVFVPEPGSVNLVAEAIVSQLKRQYIYGWKSGDPLKKTGVFHEY